MKITFRQPGGFAGLIRGCELDTDSLHPDEAAKLASLVKQSNILQAKGGRTPDVCDAIDYQIAVETSQGTHQLSCDDLSCPESAQPLLDYLQGRAQPQPLS